VFVFNLINGHLNEELPEYGKQTREAKMAKINLNKLSIPELEALQVEIGQSIDQRREQDRATLKEQMAEMASKAGFTLDDLFGKPKGKKSALPPKYRNPENPSQTWSGRGRRPNWLEEGIANGADLDDFLIG
jgi:DNA-binding protein H-NS